MKMYGKEALHIYRQPIQRSILHQLQEVKIAL